jgi:hypothetical protein
VTRYRQHCDQDEQSDQKTKKERALGMPRVALRRDRAVDKDWLGRRRCSSKSHAGVVKLAQVTPRPLGLERLSRKVGPQQFGRQGDE